MKNINRRQFLRTAGSLALGGVFLGGTGTFVWHLFKNPASFFHEEAKSDKVDAEGKADIISPYCKTAAFNAEDDVQAFEVIDGKIFAAAQNNIFVYAMNGELLDNFPIPSDVRDLALYGDRLYVLFASRIQVYDQDGEMLHEWQACNEDADYCCLTVMDSGVFVTDASNKHICQYHLDGSLVRFIESPDGFVVPSYSFAITHIDDTVYCSNPGRHQVEVYTAEGEFVRSFGEAGTAPGAFSGCCNPARLTASATGEILTSEKGRPRVSCYDTDGTFRSILLSQEMLGGGHDACNLRIWKDMIITASGRKMQVFQYNPEKAEQTLCGKCTKDCPLKVR